MPETVLTTRLTIPAPRPDRMRRARLHACLDASLHHRLTLVSAPAGFGKTTAVSYRASGSMCLESLHSYSSRHSFSVP